MVVRGLARLTHYVRGQQKSHRQISEFAAYEIKADQYQPGARHHGPSQNHGISDAKFLDGDSEHNRQNANAQNDGSADQQTNHQKLHPNVNLGVALSPSILLSHR